MDSSHCPANHSQVTQNLIHHFPFYLHFCFFEIGIFEEYIFQMTQNI